MRAQLSFLIVFLLSIYAVQQFTLPDNSPDKQYATGNATGIDLSVSDISSSLSKYNPDTSGDFRSLWLNISTISSLDERYAAKFTTPKNGRLICDSTVVGEDGLALDDRIINSI